MEKIDENVLIGVKEIARRANVSRATVDRVIHNRSGVSEKTKARINAIIQELGYKPNILAQRLAKASRETLKIVVLLPGLSEETEFWKAPLDGIAKAESEIVQYGIEIKRYFFDQNIQSSFSSAVSEILKDNDIDGVLLTPTFDSESRALLAFCERRNIPYVFINSDLSDCKKLCYIGPELYESGYLSAQLAHYCLKPEQKALVVTIAREIEGNYAVLRKEEGFLSYFKEYLSEDLIVFFNSLETAYTLVSEKLTEMLEHEDKVGVIYVTNSRVSLVAKWLESIGRKDIILIGYDFLEDNLYYLEKGLISFLICERPQEQGYRGIMSLFQYLVMSIDIKSDYLMPIDVITRANYKFYRN